MKFTVIGHASLYIEDNGKSLLIDPWLIGSCYWRSWWNFPEIDTSLIKILKPDYIYLTHLHWDHFHAPSLNLFPKNTTILVPEEPGNRMIRDLNSLGFYNTKEMKHAETVNFWSDIKLTSYQFGPFFVDSALAIENHNTCLLNANDCKLMGLPLNQIKRKHSKIDFTFRSHSSASPLPYCIDNYENNFKKHRTAQDYIDEFTMFCLDVGSKYAVPFASNHCYLHKDTIKYNDLAVSPKQVEQNYNKMCAESNFDSKCIIMSTGSAWCEENGFKIESYDYATREEDIANMSRKYKNKLEAHYEETFSTTASYTSFAKYFSNFYKKTPYLILRLLPNKIIFEVNEGIDKKYWLLDIRSKKCDEIHSITDCNFIINIDSLVINDCTKKMMFSAWGPSKRLKILLVEDKDYSKVTMFFGILDFFETDGFPILTVKHFRVGIRRWREVLTYLNILFKLKVLRKPMSIKHWYKPNPTLTNRSD